MHALIATKLNYYTIVCEVHALIAQVPKPDGSCSIILLLHTLLTIYQTLFYHTLLLHTLLTIYHTLFYHTVLLHTQVGEVLLSAEHALASKKIKIKK